jgi:Mn2+/Fe2+ NRAMP family transporter
MGRYANGLLTKAVSWALFAVITAANIWLVGRLLAAG